MENNNNPEVEKKRGKRRSRSDWMERVSGTENGGGGRGCQEVNFTLSSRSWIYRRDVHITGRGWEKTTRPVSVAWHHADAQHITTSKSRRPPPTREGGARPHCRRQSRWPVGRPILSPIGRFPSAFRSCTRLTEFNHLHSIRNRNVPASVIIKIDIYFSSMETRGWRRKQFGVGGWSRTSRKSLGPSKRRSFPRSARAPRALSFLMYETRRVGPFLSGGTIGSSVRGKWRGQYATRKSRRR